MLLLIRQAASTQKSSPPARPKPPTTVSSRDHIKDAIPTFEEYLKLLETTPVVLGKIRDMKAMDAIMRIFFSNFTITPTKEGSFKGSTVSYKLKEPWEGFVSANDFVRGAGEETLTVPTGQ